MAHGTPEMSACSSGFHNTGMSTRKGRNASCGNFHTIPDDDDICLSDSPPKPMLDDKPLLSILCENIADILSWAAPSSPPNRLRSTPGLVEFSPIYPKRLPFTVEEDADRLITQRPTRAVSRIYRSLILLSTLLILLSLVVSLINSAGGSETAALLVDPEDTLAYSHASFASLSDASYTLGSDDDEAKEDSAGSVSSGLFTRNTVPRRSLLMRADRHLQRDGDDKDSSKVKVNGCQGRGWGDDGRGGWEA